MSIELKTVGVVVKDMGKSLAFYRALGLEIPAAADDENNLDYETSQGVVLGFLTQSLAEQSDPGYQHPTGSSINLQFQCDAPHEVDAVHNRLTSAGYQSYAQPWDAFWGQRFARVTDPDGRIVNLYAHL